MRTIISFMRRYSLSCKLNLRMRLIGPLGLLMAAVIFVPTGKARIAHTPPPPMPGLRGEAATEYLKHQGLYNSSGEAVMAARYGASYRVTVDPNFTEVKKLTASDGLGSDGFGRSVAIYGDTAIVCAAAADIGSNSDQGSAYVLDRNQGGANNWGEVKKLTASDGAQGDGFGVSAAIYADTVIFGAFRGDIGSTVDQGSAYVFERNQGGANNWGEVRKLVAPDGVASNWFGIAVAIYTDTVIVGTSFDVFNEVTTPGSAYIFQRNQDGADQWGHVKKLTASDGAIADGFGQSVAIYGDTVFVGMPFDASSTSISGSTYVFERNQGGPNNWGEVKKLTASDVVPGDGFGQTVAIDADTIIIAAGGFDSFRGAAYIFVAGNTPPTISAEPVALAEAAPATNITIATVSDPGQAANTLAVTVNSSARATVNGVTVSNVTVEASGEVKADVVAACGASSAGFTLRVTDGAGLFAEATIDVTVTSENIAPTITLKPAISLWPPNHQYHAVTVVQMVESVSDNCSPLSLGDVVIEKVTSDERDNGLDDGNTTNDIVIAPDCRSVRLRAERAETNDGRVYTITLRLKDGRGNISRRDFEVSVPIFHNTAPAVKGATAHTVTAGCP